MIAFSGVRSSWHIFADGSHVRRTNEKQEELLDDLVRPQQQLRDGETESPRDLTSPSRRRSNVGASARSSTRRRHIRGRRRP